MCGIAGFWEFNAARVGAQPRAILERMTESLHHRGPDSGAVWCGEGVGLGHRRLSITDLTPAGAQPMHSEDGRYAIVFNGAIYNFREIGKELEACGVELRSRSDTEVLLEAIAVFGLEPTLRRCNGMFAFALWDKAVRELLLVRDRIGVKPLYYTRLGDKGVMFASQSKSFLQHPDFKPVLSPQSVAGYFHFGNVPAGRSIYAQVEQVPPGHIVTITSSGNISQWAYWRLPGQQREVSEETALLQLEDLLDNAVELRMLADVPVGVFLSGGVDSSAVAAYMQKNSAQPVKSFCVGFDNSELDESRFAAAVAKHLGTSHTQVVLGEGDLLSLVERIPEYYDEPFADYSMLPMLWVSQTARQQVTACLSGDGGDELFGGYSRYGAAHDLFRMRRLPAALLRLAPVLRLMPMPLLRSMGKMAGMRVTPERVRALGNMRHEDSKELLMDFYTRWGTQLPLLPPEYRQFGSDSYYQGPMESPYDMQRMDLRYYLPDDILTKVDRASMAFGLEAREPLLDHRLVEWAFSLPHTLKSPSPQTKRLLRKLLYRQVPASLIERPKQGFTPPLRGWLRGTLRDWAESLLNEQSMAQDGLLDAKRIRQCWQAHASGAVDHTYRLWGVLMFLQWRRHYKL